MAVSHIELSKEQNENLICDWKDMLLQMIHIAAIQSI